MKKLLMVLVLMPLMGLADKETVDGIEWTYTVKDGKARIEEGLSQSATGSITIPSMLGGCSVTSIGDSAFCGCSNLTSVTIPASLTNVCRCAFSNCGALRSFAVDDKNAKYSSRSGLLCSKDGMTLVAGVNGDVTIPSCVKNIGDYAFRGCDGLKSVMIPHGVESIGSSAFSGCIGLASVVIPASVKRIGRYAFARCSGLMSFCVDEGNSSYSSRNGLLCSKDGATLVAGVNCDAVIPPCVKNIEGYAFDCCSGLKAVVIPSTVASIGAYAFGRCSGLKTVEIPSSVVDIGFCAFYGCSGLKSFSVSSDNPSYSSHNGLLCSKDGAVLIAGVNGNVTIPDVVTSIGECAFQRYEELVSVAIPSSVTNIGMCAFSECSSLFSVRIPPSVRCVEECAFQGCGKIRELEISKGVTRIGEHAFSWCDEIESVTIPQGVASIGDGAFYRCLGLKSVTMPSGLVSVGKYAFFRCNGLSSVMIPSTVTSIGEGAFFECAGLKTVVMSSHVTSIGSGAFAKTPFYDTLPDGMVILGGGVLCKYKGKCPSSVTIPTNVASVGENAFRGCGELESLTIPSTLTNIDGRAFVDCPKLKLVHIVRDGKAETIQFDDFFRQWKNVVAQRLQKCDFLLNGRFKKNAKVYLCLFSASWCGPCRKEMPRIAKTYAEKLKDDPDIELIHFSRDQNDDKALAWANEHNVKFPVVKPKGGNPLNLHCDGIPHLFIVKADGTLIEEGHPMRIFNEEKFREIKEGKGAPMSSVPATKELKWSYEVINGGVIVGGEGKPAVPKDTSGILPIPDIIEGLPVRAIGDHAFAGCDKLTAIVFSTNVTEIGWSAFSGCGGLTSVTIPEGVTSIGNGAFSGCCGLTTVTIPSSVTNIGMEAFSSSPLLYSRKPRGYSVRSGRGPRGSRMVSFSVVSNNASYSSRNGMLCSKDGTTLISGVNGNVTIPDGVKNIGSYAFSDCYNLKSVTISPGVTNIGFNAFCNCRALRSVVIPASVVSIHRNSYISGAFKGCIGLKSFSVDAASPSYSSRNGMLCSKDGASLIVGLNGDVEIPSGVKSIENWAFSGYRDLKSLAIPPGVTNIGEGAFCWCSGLKTVVIPKGVTRIGAQAFFKTPFYDNMSDGSVVLGDGVLYGYKGECPSSVIVPTNVAHIGARAFSGDHFLSIGLHAYRMKSVTISSTVMDIATGAFYGCRGLTNIVVDCDSAFYCGEGGILYNKAKTELLCCPAGRNGTVTIPSSVMKIGEEAFFGCGGLTSVTMPSSLTNAVKSAFGREGTLSPSANGMVTVVFEKSGAAKNTGAQGGRPLGGGLLRARRLQRRQ